MTYEQAKTALEENGQGHVLQFWKKLSAAERKALLAQVETIDFKELARCKAMVAGGGRWSPAAARPPRRRASPPPRRCTSSRARR